MRAGALLFAVLIATSICCQAACGGDEDGNGLYRLPDGGYASPATCTAGTPTPSCDTSGDPGTAVSIASGMFHTCALFSGGTVKCWGDNSYGQLGVGVGCLQYSAVPLTVSNLCNAKAISAGDLHTCALLQDGTVACWGNGGPQLIADRTSPMTIDAGGDNQCEIIAGSGQTETVGSKPGIVPCLTGVTSVAAGNSFDCAVLKDGTVQCWSSLPAAAIANVSGAVSVAVEGTSGCAVLQDTTVKCWGANESGELGNGTTTPSASAVSVLNVTGAIGITASETVSGTSKCRQCYGLSCALIDGGTAQCWGEDQDGELGNGTTELMATTAPVSVLNLTSAVSLTAGEGHVFAILGDGTIAGWGANRCGELGDGNTDASTEPVRVQTLDHVIGVSSGACHACALIADGGVQCWGDNNYGVLGNGENNDFESLTPVQVAW